MKNKKKKLQLLTESIGQLVRVGSFEYCPALFIGDKLITSGIDEVNRRIDVLIRERGLQYEVNNDE